MAMKHTSTAEAVNKAVKPTVETGSTQTAVTSTYWVNLYIRVPNLIDDKPDACIDHNIGGWQVSLNLDETKVYARCKEGDQSQQAAWARKSAENFAMWLTAIVQELADNKQLPEPGQRRILDVDNLGSVESNSPVLNGSRYRLEIFNYTPGVGAKKANKEEVLQRMRELRKQGKVNPAIKARSLDDLVKLQEITASYNK